MRNKQVCSKEVTDEISKLLGMRKRDVSNVLDKLRSVIKSSLQNGNDVLLRGFMKIKMSKFKESPTYLEGKKYITPACKKPRIKIARSFQDELMTTLNREP